MGVMMTRVLAGLALLLACGGDDVQQGADGGDLVDGGASVDGTGASDAAATDAGTDSDAAESDLCPFAGGVTWLGKTRFVYGVNYAWLHFAGDFGGISAWGQSGVVGEAAAHTANLADMREHGVSVIRWWVFPDFRGDGVVFDSQDRPTGLSAGAVADVAKALELAEDADVYLMLCVFSFDDFRPSAEVSGIWTPSIEPMVSDPGQRTMLLENVVRPLARAVDDSPYRDRLIAWDVINEPEWAMTGASPYGDPDYEPMGDLDPVTHAVMESFVADTIAVLRQESDALITVGAAAFKWRRAWKNLDLDFYQFHMYSWINDWWPYTSSPADYELDDKPLVMGEYPMGDLAAGASFADVTSSWYGNGYAGALSWQYNEADATALDLVAGFASQHACETRF